MISIKCPHCHIGLKVDEDKLPQGLTSFKCPKCKQTIQASALSCDDEPQKPSDTVLIRPVRKNSGKITVLPANDTPEQTFLLPEGISIIGRKSSKQTGATIALTTSDRLMSREHIRIDTKKDEKSGYKHYLSDNNSKNHTLYNNNYLKEDEVVILNDNDEIIIGRTILRFNY